MDKLKYTVGFMDDQPESIRIFRKMLERFEFLTQLEPVSSIQDALNMQDVQPVDILFLDLQMPELMGWQFVKLLEKPPVIIVVSSFGHYGFEVNDINAVAYLKKLPDWEHLKKAVEEAVKKVDERNKISIYNSTTVRVRNFETKQEEILKHIDIVYAEVDDKEITIFLDNGNKVIYQKSLTTLMGLLPDDKFVRISAKHIVAIHAIKSYSRTKVHLTMDDICLDINYKTALRVLDLYHDNKL